jgi:hypothetical protein
MSARETLFCFPAAMRRDPAVTAWIEGGDALHGLVEPSLRRLRDCGPDVSELIHDGRPTICAGYAAFAYIDAHAAHANIGFFFGAFLDDPAGLLKGTGKRMRHVKLRPGQMPDEAALGELVMAAYNDIQRRLAASEGAEGVR